MSIKRKKRKLIAILRSQNNLCILCGQPPVNPTIDHIIPKSKGGTNNVDNLQVACKSCNEKKDNGFLKFVPRRKRPRTNKRKWQKPNKE